MTFNVMKIMIRYHLILIAALIPAIATPEDFSAQAVQTVMSAPCLDTRSIEQTLSATIKRSTQRDLGWHVFPETSYVDVERSILLNKSMRLRYRWRVFPDGRVVPANERATKLCSSP